MAQWHMITLIDALVYITQRHKHSGLTVMCLDTLMTPAYTHWLTYSEYTSTLTFTLAYALVLTHEHIFPLTDTFIHWGTSSNTDVLILINTLAKISMWTHTITHTKARTHTHSPTNKW